MRKLEQCGILEHAVLLETRPVVWSIKLARVAFRVRWVWRASEALAETQEEGELNSLNIGGMKCNGCATVDRISRRKSKWRRCLRVKAGVG